MKNVRRRVSAFTIMEMTIAMLISALVIMTAYTAFRDIKNYYTDFNRKQARLQLLLRLDELLKKDFDKSDKITSEPGKIVFKFTPGQVEYDFTADYILRLSNITDTFRLKSSSLAIYFHQQMLEAADSTPAGHENYIDELSFLVHNDQQNFPYHYFKRYSSENLLNLSPYAGH
jgi:Tfp pilus assembly protein FimT